MTYKLFHGMVDHYWTRGALTIAWAGAGLTITAYHAFMARKPAPQAALPGANLPGRRPVDLRADRMGFTGRQVTGRGVATGRARPPRWGSASSRLPVRDARRRPPGGPGRPS